MNNDLSKITDRELEERISKCYDYMSYNNLQNHPTLIDSVRFNLDQLLEEKHKRIDKEIYNELTSDPSFMKPITLGKLETEDIMNLVRRAREKTNEKKDE